MLRQLVDSQMRVHHPRPDGLLLSQRLARRLGLQLGDQVSVAVLEGRRPRADMTVTGLVDEMLGIGAYAEIATVHRLMGEADAISSASIAAGGDTSVLRRLLTDRPKIATISERSVSLRQFRETTLTFVLVMAGTLSLFSVMIAIGVVYNHARITLQERAWELASLRVLGFTRREVAGVLLTELLVQFLIALPIGLYLGKWFVRAIIAMHDTELFEIPAIIHPRSYALAAIVLLLSGVATALLVRRRIGGLDLVAVLKTRECSMPRIRHLMLPLAVVAIVGVLGLALRPRPVDVEVARVERGHFEASIVEDGKTRVRDRYTIAAPVAGTLLRTGLKAGDAVEADIAVASIVPNLAPLLDARARQEAEQRLGAAEAAEARTAALERDVFRLNR
jgi:hypothetical protein